jgi:hypothetical protein
LDADSDFTGNSSSSSSDSESDDSENGEKEKKAEKEDKIEGNKVKAEDLVSGSEEGEIIDAGEDKKQTKRKHSTVSKEETSENSKKIKDEDGNEKRKNSEKRDDDKENKENINKDPEVPKPSIWEKRTVGAVLDAALERYFARKAAKSAGRK